MASFALHRWLANRRIAKTVDYGPRWRAHFVRITSDADLDGELHVAAGIASIRRHAERSCGAAPRSREEQPATTGPMTTTSKTAVMFASGLVVVIACAGLRGGPISINARTGARQALLAGGVEPNPAIDAAFVTLAGGPRSHIVLIPTASLPDTMPTESSALARSGCITPQGAARRRS